MDAVDRQWHLTSATPYDPPLTYGGWKQAQALGARVANILHSRETTLDSQIENGVFKHPSSTAVEGYLEKYGHLGHGSSKTKRRKQRVIIHSSPFLRCIQTSVAISAGLEQHRDLQNPTLPISSKPHYPPHPMHSGSPHLRAKDSWNSQHLSAIPEPDDADAEDSQESASKPKKLFKSRLRLDAFLGEWLSPEYFEMITTPPDSVMMVAGAKADLLRLKQVEIVQNLTKNVSNRGNFPGGWGNDESKPRSYKKDDGPLQNMSDMNQKLPKISRSNSHSRLSSADDWMHQNTAKLEHSAVSDEGGYVPPTPAYAISPSDAIPAGYVAHARDACVEVDYQWDSMRMPHDWGDGGKIGEEWSSMHKRFRRGLQGMITWYRNCDTKERQLFLQEEGVNGIGPRVESDEETDTVLVLVTHGAGCNALISALANQPVLLDVGMASLTMAVRKEKADGTGPSSTTTSPSPRQRSIIDTGISDDYQVKMIASTDHLRLPSHSSTPSIQHRSPTSEPFTPSQRYRSGSAISTSSSTSTLDASFHLDSLDHDGVSSPKPAATIGLWTKPVPQIEAVNNLEDENNPTSPRRFRIPPDRPDEKAERKANNDFVKAKAKAVPDEDLGRFATQRGLWGAPPQALGTAREKGPKRRWTHSDDR